MTIVTLTSDWNKSDYYLGVLKGRLASLSLKINLLEITNSIPSFDILQETFILRSTYLNFPANSIHLLGVMCEPTPESPMIIVYANSHYFIGINDGRFSQLFENPPSMAFAINQDDNFSSFMAPALFARGVKTILENSFEANTKACDLKRESVARVVYDENTIVGKVVYIDSFGNAVSNIEKSVFDRVHRARNFTIFVQGPHIKIKSISRGYYQGNPGGLMALFNSIGLLEISLYMDSLAKLESIVPGSEIRIKFENEKG
ncbi:MAG: SAM-dependent chlorinase/fluorinase [Bacteroidales bacterium]|jgi:S-adenosylmethionine hydrolase|nr:SAM-dependent chlorinase/fluorinase [Bacteroidales bacterium]